MRPLVLAVAAALLAAAAGAAAGPVFVLLLAFALFAAGAPELGWVGPSAACREHEYNHVEGTPHWGGHK